MLERSGAVEAGGRQILQALVLHCFEFCAEDEGASVVSFNLGREGTGVTSQMSQAGCPEAGGAVISKEVQ